MSNNRSRFYKQPNDVSDAYELSICRKIAVSTENAFIATIITVQPLCSKDEQEPKRKSTQEPRPDTSMTMSIVKEKTDVLLQTATTYAYGEDKSKKVTNC